MNARAILNISPIIPVVSIEDENDALNLANALIEGGINIIEITLRTPAGIKAIEQIAKHLPDMVVGAGTVLNPEQFDAVCNAGAKFVITPGCTPDLLQHIKTQTIPLIPGVATASEIMTAMTYGLDTFKLFPAQIAGGVGALKAFQGPFEEVKFCPTGGVNIANIRDFLQLKNVSCVGGTWIAPKDLIAQKEFGQITKLCKEALELL